jgi:hypothetical protein
VPYGIVGGTTSSSKSSSSNSSTSTTGLVASMLLLTLGLAVIKGQFALPIKVKTQFGSTQEQTVYGQKRGFV